MDWWVAHSEAVITLIIGAAIGVFADWVFFRKSDKPRKLGWEVRGNSEIINATTDQRPYLKLVYIEADGAPETVVENPNQVIVRVGNVGKRALTSENFQDPIKIQFPTSALRAAKIFSTSGPEVKAKLDSKLGKPNLVLLSPNLINKHGDWLEIQFVTDGEAEDPNVTGTVVDGDMVQFSRTTKTRTIALFLLLCLAGVAALASSSALALIAAAERASLVAFQAAESLRDMAGQQTPVPPPTVHGWLPPIATALAAMGVALLGAGAISIYARSKDPWKAVPKRVVDKSSIETNATSQQISAKL